MTEKDERMKRTSKCSSLTTSVRKKIVSTADSRHDAQRQYRSIAEIARKLELCEVSRVESHFSEEAIQLRDKLREQSTHILLTSPVEYGRKVEDILWKRCYYNVMHFYKRWRMKKVSSEGIQLLEVHFTSGIGHYKNLILTIAKHNHIKLNKIFPIVVAFANLDDWNDDVKKDVMPSEETLEWAQQAIHRMIIYMGDLARYLNEVGQSNGHDLAVRFYNAALIWNDEMGMPFNQLGTLSDANNSNYGLDSAYYYMRCLYCTKPFDGAEMNLRRIFESNSKVVIELTKPNSPSANLTEESFVVVKRAYSHFLKLCNEFWFKDQTREEETQLSTLIQDVLSYFKSAFDLKPKLSTNLLPTYLSPLAIFEISVISLMIVKKLSDRKTSGISTPPTELSAKFALSFLSQVISACHLSVQAKLGAEENKSNGFLINFSPGVSKENTPEMSPRRALSRLRRRKAAVNYTGDNMLSNENDSDMSELEETAMSMIDALEINTDISDSSDEEEEDLIKFDMGIVSSDEESAAIATCKSNIPIGSSQSAEQSKSVTSTAIPEAESLLTFFLNESPLPTIKMYCDWLRANASYLSYIASSSSFQGFFDDFVEFCNTLMEIQERVLLTFPHLNEFKSNDILWVQKYPLESDIALSNLKLMQSAFVNREIRFDCQRQLSLTEKSFICIQSILNFCNWLSGKSDFLPASSSIIFDINEKRFKMSNLINGSDDVLMTYESTLWNMDNNLSNDAASLSRFSEIIQNNEEHNSINNDVEMQHQQMMRGIEHIWSNNESKDSFMRIGHNNQQIMLNLVIDSSAFYHLNLIKQLADSKSFILLVPILVVAALDQEKKSSIQVRDAIRWLETEMTYGNRRIKFQREIEKLSLAPIKYPKKKDKNACDFFELLEYCNYLMKNMSNSGNNWSISNSKVILLTSNNHKWPLNGEIIAKSAGINVEYIESFVSRLPDILKGKT